VRIISKRFTSLSATKITVKKINQQPHNARRRLFRSSAFASKSSGAQIARLAGFSFGS
jgi:hypothetical protein